MADLAHVLTIPTARPPGFAGDRPLSANVIEQTAPISALRPVYGAPSLVPAAGFIRQKVTYAAEFYTRAPMRNEYDRVVVWAGASQQQYRAPLGHDPQLQRGRTFGGVSKPYYWNVQAPSLAEVQRFMGGVVNSHG